MTADEIRKTERSVDGPTETQDASAIQFWLREIAYQLAVMNESPKCSQCLDMQQRMLYRKMMEAQKG